MHQCDLPEREYVNAGWPGIFFGKHNLSCFIWLELVPNEDYDLEPSILSDYPQFDPPLTKDGQPRMTWLEYELEGSRWDFIDWGINWRCDFPFSDWALHHGVAPEQPFLVRFDAWYSGPDWNGEYDAGCEWKLISISKMDPKEVLHRWEKLTKKWITFKEAMKEKKQKAYWG
jgi:hypothetical protein